MTFAVISMILKYESDGSCVKCYPVHIAFELFLSLPHEKLDKLALQQRLNAIGKS